MCVQCPWSGTEHKPPYWTSFILGHLQTEGGGTDSWRRASSIGLCPKMHDILSIGDRKWKFLFSFFLTYLLCIQYPACMYACRTEKGTRSYYRWLWATIWLLGIEFRTFGRAGSALNHWVISPAWKRKFLTWRLGSYVTECKFRGLEWPSLGSSWQASKCLWRVSAIIWLKYFPHKITLASAYLGMDVARWWGYKWTFAI